MAMTKNGTKRLPRRKRIRLAAPDYRTPEAWYFVTICCLKNHSLLQSPVRRDMVLALLIETAEEQFVEMAAFTILPNHLHIICSAGRAGVIDFVRLFKGRTTKRLRERRNLSNLWQKSFFDHKLRNEESLHQKCSYVWMNPVRRGLARRPEDYRWSGCILSD